MSAEAFWKEKQGPFMFGPRPKDLKACTNGSSREETSSLRMAVQREQSCSLHSACQHALSQTLCFMIRVCWLM